jgi:hypothetical protein
MCEAWSRLDLKEICRELEVEGFFVIAVSSDWCSIFKEHLSREPRRPPKDFCSVPAVSVGPNVSHQPQRGAQYKILPQKCLELLQHRYGLAPEEILKGHLVRRLSGVGLVFAKENTMSTVDIYHKSDVVDSRMVWPDFFLYPWKGDFGKKRRLEPCDLYLCRQDGTIVSEEAMVKHIYPQGKFRPFLTHGLLPRHDRAEPASVNIPITNQVASMDDDRADRGESTYHGSLEQTQRQQQGQETQRSPSKHSQTISLFPAARAGRGDPPTTDMHCRSNGS